MSKTLSCERQVDVRAGVAILCGMAHCISHFLRQDRGILLTEWWVGNAHDESSARGYIIMECAPDYAH